LHECQYAGTIKVSDKNDVNLFYWYFKHSDPEAPLIIWINGGPGASSMFGLFYENGPLRVEQNGDEFKLTGASRSWADDYNIVFLD
jgi:carboxypeptidase C (cathepsin A)